jgi:uncharacterized protein (TIGR00369 family)
MARFDAANPDFARVVQDTVLSMPAARHLGFRFGDMAPGEAEIIQPYRPELTQLAGYFQGGILGALADFAGGSAAGTLLPEGWMNMTIDYTVKILAPAQGEQVIARGRVLKPGKQITVATVEVLAGDAGKERLSATALVTMQNMPVAA